MKRSNSVDYPPNLKKHRMLEGWRYYFRTLFRIRPSIKTIPMESQGKQCRNNRAVLHRFDGYGKRVDARWIAPFQEKTNHQF